MRSQLNLTDEQIEHTFGGRVSVGDIEFTKLPLNHFPQARWKWHMRGVIDEYIPFGKFVCDHVRVSVGDSPKTIYVVDFGNIRGVAWV